MSKSSKGRKPLDVKAWAVVSTDTGDTLSIHLTKSFADMDAELTSDYTINAKVVAGRFVPHQSVTEIMRGRRTKRAEKARRG